MAGAEDTAWRGAALLFIYSLGMGLPFLAASVFAGPFVAMMKRMRAHLGMIEKVMGGLLVVTGILFMTGQMSVIGTWMLETFPWLGTSA
jgi:cytochrome c-type biogenesis protein